MQNHVQLRCRTRSFDAYEHGLGCVLRHVLGPTQTLPGMCSRMRSGRILGRVRTQSGMCLGTGLDAIWDPFWSAYERGLGCVLQGGGLGCVLGRALGRIRTLPGCVLGLVLEHLRTWSEMRSGTRAGMRSRTRFGTDTNAVWDAF